MEVTQKTSYPKQITCSIYRDSHSDFALDLEITTCILLFYDTRFPSTTTQ